MIAAAAEDAIRQVSEDAGKPGTAQDGLAEDDKDTAEITSLTSRAGNWFGSLRWIVRRVKPSRRHFKNLTDCEKTGWKYSITCANINAVACGMRTIVSWPGSRRHDGGRASVDGFIW
jgi:hypothetical protein